MPNDFQSFLTKKVRFFEECFNQESKLRAKAEHLNGKEKGNAMILSCENSPQATGAVRACTHTNTTVIRKEGRRTDFRKSPDMTPP